jgi:hypothetical protein
MATRETSRPITSLMTQVVSDLAYLLQTEIRLAKAEIGEKFAQVARGGAYIGVGGILALTGLFLLLLSVVRWLDYAGLPERWGLLLVGGSVLGVGAVLALMGSKNFTGSALTPDRTIEQVRADFNVAKEHVR